METTHHDPNLWKWRLAALAWMALIFLFSSALFAPTMEFDATEEVFGDLNYLMRKCAHVAEYAILTFLLFRALWSQRESFGAAVFAAAAVAVFYASTDEYHQTFVPARSGKASDLLFDGTGAVLTALWLTYLWTRADAARRIRFLGPLAGGEETENRDSGK